jgi:dihydrofolate reductase
MAKLIYTAITSLDGYIEDQDGKFDWSMPSVELHQFINDLERPVGTYLYGRRLYETMVYWENPPADSEPVELDYASVWKSAEKIVYSKSLQKISSVRTRLEREFDPDEIRRMKEAAGSDLSIGGAMLAAQAIKAGLVDEYRLFVFPVTIGGGKRVLPDGVRLGLELIDERRFDNGAVYLRYKTRP